MGAFHFAYTGELYAESAYCQSSMNQNSEISKTELSPFKPDHLILPA